VAEGVAEGEAEEDDAADGVPVRAEVGSGLFPSAEVVSGSAGPVRAGSGSDELGRGAWSGSSAVANVNPPTAEITAAASAHAGASTTTTTPRSHPRIRCWRRSHRSTANAPRSMASTAKSTTSTTAVMICIIRPTSYATGALYFVPASSLSSENSILPGTSMNKSREERRTY
jgi:hypothetical protein